MRITTNAILRNYRSNLGTSMANLNTSRNKVMTGRQFVSSAENPGSVNCSAKLRKYDWTPCRTMACEASWPSSAE